MIRLGPMAKISILNPDERKHFDQPPNLTSHERKQYLKLTEGLKPILETLRSPSTRVFFLVSVGYFKATKRFYTKDFHDVDVAYAAKQLGLDPEKLETRTYDRVTQQRHKQMILEYFNFEAYSKAAEAKVLPDLKIMVRSQKRPKIILQQLIENLLRHRIEIPTYHALSRVIGREMQKHKEELLASIKVNLNADQKQLLNNLLGQESVEGKQVQRYTLSLLKRFSQSVKPRKINETITNVEQFKRQYQSLESILDVLALPHEGLQYYAQSVLNARSFQTLRRSKEDRYLHLIAFIAHQLYRGQDVLIDILLKTTQTTLNAVDREHKDKVFEHHKEYRRSVKRLVSLVQRGFRSPLDSIESITANKDLNSEAKLEQIVDLLLLIKTERSAAEEELDLLDDKTRKTLEDAEYYDLLESKSRQLQNRVAGILKFLDFKGKDKPLLEAVSYFQAKEGSISHTSPIAFLSEEEQQVLYDEKGKFRISLYKILLFREVAEKLKSGRLHIKHSYKYRSLDDYLIPLEKWQTHRAEYLAKAGMTEFEKAASVIAGLKERLDTQYHQINTGILQSLNPFIKLRKKNTFVLSTPKAEASEAEPLSNFFPKGHYISLPEVLQTVNGQGQFLEGFEHWQHRQHQRPSDQSFFAGIMGYGCNIGLNKLLRISKSIREAEVETTANGYFNLDNLIAANDRIVALMDSMTVAEFYRSESEKLHTSSDGQKFELSVDSLMASHSFKYFGQGQGVSSYSFVDERNLAFYSTVISANEREVAYVIDGLMHNDVIQSDIHSTDTHGYSELLFGVTHLLDFYFAPRIKGFAKQRMYSFEKIAHYKALNYPILPDAYIDVDLIEKYWDEILRFVVTIKLKEASASQLFKRLNSYSKQHPLYKALKEFGKIIKSLYMLSYISDVKLRQAIEKQLNKGELSNRFNRAISFGGNQQLSFAEKEVLDIADACRRLIRNAVLCWNYLYLSKQLAQAKPDKQSAIIQSMKAGSPITWQHINMHGEYDFSDEKLVDSMGLSNPNLIHLNQLDFQGSQIPT